MRSELPFCKTTFLRKQLISPVPFGLSRAVKESSATLYWQSKNFLIAVFPIRLALQIVFQSFLLISEKWISKLLEEFFGFFSLFS